MSELLQNLPTRHHKAFSCLEVPTGNGAHTSNGALSPTVWEQSIPSPRYGRQSQRSPPVVVSKCGRDDELFAQIQGHCIGLLRSAVELEPEDSTRKQKKLYDCWKKG